MKANHQDETARSQPQAPKPRRRAPMDKPPSPNVEGLTRSLEAARAKPASMDKVRELSELALAIYKTGQVAISYNTFAEAMRAAHSLSAHFRQDALSHLLVVFKKTEMDSECYFGLLRTCGAPPQMHAR
ncbi:hypothetical protein H0O01_01730 [Candidatus Micrarchaeota archaeon]|nr:hypothetical protein [Candidatus Micrarchaeota archaeon]